MSMESLVFDEALSSDGTTLRRARFGEERREVVVKTLEVHKLESWKAMELFEREARVLRNLNHPGIPRYLDAGQLEGGDAPVFYLVQEFIAGRDLQQRLDAIEDLGGGVFDEAEARRFLRQMLEILQYLNGLNPPVIHRNIKPSNIIARPDGSYALVDFGSVQAVLPQTMTGSTFVGTTGYMAPEQMMARAVPASDIFSLGATTIHLLGGVHPGHLPVRRMTLDFSRVLTVSDELRRILQKMVAPKVEDRYGSPAEIIEDLGPVHELSLKSEEEEDFALALPASRSSMGKALMTIRADRLEIEFPSEGPADVLFGQMALLLMVVFALVILPGPLKLLTIAAGLLYVFLVLPKVYKRPTLVLDRDEVRFEHRGWTKTRTLMRMPVRQLEFKVTHREPTLALHGSYSSTFIFRTPQDQYALPFDVFPDEGRRIAEAIEGWLAQTRGSKG
jgi:hypothetical protein